VAAGLPLIWSMTIIGAANILYNSTSTANNFPVCLSADDVTHYPTPGCASAAAARTPGRPAAANDKIRSQVDGRLRPRTQ
jgi:hypothetical protein